MKVLTGVGLGCNDAQIAVYIANVPPLAEYQQLDHVSPAIQGEIAAIGQQCGNGWRKVFNVYAKLLYALDSSLFSFSKMAPTWQQYRDEFLLQPKSKTALFFGPPHLVVAQQTSKPIHIIMGRTYAKTLIKEGYITEPLRWLDDDFAINMSQRLIVCPYFDYRQLSNIKIERLAKLIKEMG